MPAKPASISVEQMRIAALDVLAGHIPTTVQPPFDNYANLNGAHVTLIRWPWFHLSGSPSLLAPKLPLTNRRG